MIKHFGVYGYEKILYVKCILLLFKINLRILSL